MNAYGLDQCIDSFYNDVSTIDLSSYTTTSAKIRALDSMNVSRSDIAKMLNIRYQHVRNVLTTELKRK